MSDAKSPFVEAAPTFAGVSKAEVTAWKQAHGDDRIRLCSVGTGATRLQFIVKAPERTEYDRYVAALTKADRDYNKISVATRNILGACLLAPTLDEVRAIWDRFPALADKMAEPILQMAGAESEVREETF